MWVVLFILYEFFNIIFEIRQVNLDNFPYFLCINPKIIMDNKISKSFDLLPGNMGMLSLQILA